MLLWTTAFIPLLLATKGIDLAAFGWFASFEVFPAALIGVCIVITTLSTIWLTLGLEQLRARWLAFLGATVGAGAHLQMSPAEWKATYGRWPNMTLMRLAIEMREDRQWPVWFALTSALLAAMLLSIRACNYRLADWRRQAA